MSMPTGQTVRQTVRQADGWTPEITFSTTRGQRNKKRCSKMWSNYTNEKTTKHAGVNADS